MDPGDDHAWLTSSAIHGQLGDMRQVEACCRRVLALKPDSKAAYVNLGNALRAQEQWEEALDSYRAALKVDPGVASVHYSVAVVAMQLGRIEEAEASLRRVLEMQPENVAAWSRLGALLKGLGRFDESQRCYEKALRVNPNDKHSLLGLGIVLAAQEKFEDALARYEQVLQLDPKSGAAFTSIGLAYESLHRYEQAARFFQSALDVDRQNPLALSRLIHALQYICKWDRCDELIRQLEQIIRDQGKEAFKGISPFEQIIRSTSVEDARSVAEVRSGKIAERVQGHEAFSFEGRSILSKKRIRIGYLSNDFHNHPTAHLMRGMFRLHDHEQFEIFGYAYDADDGSAYREQIKNYCDEFFDIRDLSFYEAAERIFADQIDILIDLKGHTLGARLEICALRPAPVQVTYLGFPGTSGAAFFDYVVADRILIPEQDIPFYSERVVYMPNSYQANDDLQDVAPRSFARGDFGLPEEALVFCSFNQSYKIDAVMYRVWMDILAALSGSVLWLLHADSSAENNLRRAAKARGIDGRRLVFTGHLPKAEHLARLRLADMALDTRIYNGHTTTSDALSVGVPVIALQGDHFASRVSASLLTAHQVPELVCRTPDEYRSLAIALGSDPEKLAALKDKLARLDRTTPLFDSERFTRDFERALKEMWRIYAGGQSPQTIDVATLG